MTNEASQNRWTLFRRPYAKGIVTLLICFGVICFISRPRSLLDFAACAMCTLALPFVFDCCRNFMYPAALRFVGWGLFFPLAFVLLIACGIGVEYAGRQLGIALPLLRAVVFMFLAAGSGALGAISVEKLRNDEQSAS